MTELFLLTSTSAAASGRFSTSSIPAGAPPPPKSRRPCPRLPSYSAVRALLRILEAKQYVRHEHDGPRYVYVPTIARDSAKRSALRHLVRTFFDGSTEQAMAALLDVSSARLSDAELERLSLLIDKARDARRDAATPPEPGPVCRTYRDDLDHLARRHRHQIERRAAARARSSTGCCSVAPRPPCAMPSGFWRWSRRWRRRP